MKFARDCRSSESNEVTAQLLFEALPWTLFLRHNGKYHIHVKLPALAHAFHPLCL